MHRVIMYSLNYCSPFVNYAPTPEGNIGKLISQLSSCLQQVTAVITCFSVKNNSHFMYRWQERILMLHETHGKTLYKNFLMTMHCFLWKLMGVVKNKDMVSQVTAWFIVQQIDVVTISYYQFNLAV